MKTHIAAYLQIYRFTKKPTGNTVTRCGDVVSAARLASKRKATCEVCQRRARRREVPP